MMEISKELFLKLNSEEVRYYLGTNEITTDVESRIVKLLNDIQVLCHKANQLDYLEGKGVDNWSEYSTISYDDEEDEENY